MAGIAGLGAIFKRWDGVSAWVAIGSISNIAGPSMSRTTIDTTTLDTAGGYMTFIAGLRDPGGVVLSMNFTRTTYETMKDDFESDTLQNYEIILPDTENTSLEFEGLVTELPLAIPVNEKLTADVTIKISGQVTLNSGAASAAPA